MADEPDDADEADATFNAQELAMIARIEKAVTDNVMAQVRPLLAELAKAAQAKGQQKAPGSNTTDSLEAEFATDAAQLQKEFERKVEAMRRTLADRIKVSEAKFLSRIKNSL